MKQILLNMAIITLIMIGSTFVVNAQDILKTDPKSNNVLVDTTIMRAMITTYQPGQKTELHTHPSHFVYALTDGKLKVHFDDGKSEVFEVKAGESFYSGPEKPHRTENIGDKAVKFIMVEFKEHQDKASRK
jgi:quercetin dioxygenase-like cupin family protein